MRTLCADSGLSSGRKQLTHNYVTHPYANCTSQIIMCASAPPSLRSILELMSPVVADAHAPWRRLVHQRCRYCYYYIIAIASKLTVMDSLHPSEAICRAEMCSDMRLDCMATMPSN